MDNIWYYLMLAQAVDAVSTVPESAEYHRAEFRVFQIDNPLNTKRRLLYLKTQFVPRSKHFSSRL